MSVKAIELGCAGHLIVSNKCRWKRHTQVGNYRVSSIGDYYPGRDGRDTIGSGPRDYFETLVFRTTPNPEQGSEGCGCMSVNDYCELDGERYATAGEAQAGHEKYVKRYLALARKEAK
jgi:hypothetical protein